MSHDTVSRPARRDPVATSRSATASTAHYVACDEEDAIDWTKTLLGYLPRNYLDEPPRYRDDAAASTAAPARRLNELVQDPAGGSYDMLDVLAGIVDDSDLLQVQSALAPSMVCAFARIAGRTVAIVANQPGRASGAIDRAAAAKAARFVTFCDAFGIPLLTFVDTCGLAEPDGGVQPCTVDAAAELGRAYAVARVPSVTVVTGHAHGVGFQIMNPKQLGADLTLAWPTADFAAAAGGAGGTESLYLAAERGAVDAVIAPCETRTHVVRALEMLRTKQVETQRYR